MPKFNTHNLVPHKKRFHDVPLTVYPTNLPLSKIDFWSENNRTLFTFEKLIRDLGRKLEDISIDEVTNYVANSPVHSLDDLAKSIRNNGVQVPLIVRDDGKLLDGNRRFFACHLIRMQDISRSVITGDILDEIPVLIIHESDLNKTLELKIIAEANFIQDLKLPWPLDAQARAVEEFYNNYKTEINSDHDLAIAEVVSIFGISRQRANDLLGALKLTKVFISEADSDDEKIRRRSIVEDKFIYFWEFVNKAMKGRSAYNDEDELKEVRDMFFSLVSRGKQSFLRNTKQIEPLVQSKRDRNAWSLLKSSEGSKLDVVVSMINEKKAVRKSEDKIRLFLIGFMMLMI